MTLQNRTALKPHQIQAVRFALPRRRCYLGLDPGLGKTAVAATLARKLGMPVVYVSPPFLVSNVENEIGRWAPSLKVGVYGNRADDALQQLDVLILPDSLLALRSGITDDVRAFLRGRPGLLLVDEAHRFKNAQSRRTSALLGEKGGRGLVDLFERRAYMSGTPIPNRPMELYALLAKEAPDTIDFMTEFEFGRRFCDGKQVQIGWDRFNGRPKLRWDFSGASNVKELKARVQGTAWPFMLRMRKDLLDLPPRIEEVFIVSEDLSPRLARLDRAVSKAYGDADDVIKHRLAAGEGKAGEELHVATYRRLLGLEKVKPASDYLKALLENPKENILVFALHKEVVERLKVALADFDPIIITGDTPKARRQKLVDEFQASPTRRLILGNVLAMGVGFTLTKAARVVFVEFDWVPGNNAQAGDRAHRLGQINSVLIQYVVYKNSMDKNVIEAILKKSDATKLL